MLRKGGRSGAGHSREHYGDGLPVAHAPPLVPEERRRSLGLPVLQESSQVWSWKESASALLCSRHSMFTFPAPRMDIAAKMLAVSAGHAAIC